jgi:hypothetical protein
MAETRTVERGDVVRLKGPARDQLVLVLDGPRGRRRGEQPDVLAAPVRSDVDRTAASTLDVLCPPDSTSDVGQTLVVAAWATATVPLLCLGERVGAVEDTRVFDAIRDVRLGLVDSQVKPPADLVGLVDLKGGEVQLPWHAEVQAAMAQYWDGSAVAQCEQEASETTLYPVWAVSTAPSLLLPTGLESCATFNWDVALSDELLKPVQVSKFFIELGGLGYRVEQLVVDLTGPSRMSGQWGVVVPTRQTFFTALGSWLRGQSPKVEPSPAPAETKAAPVERRMFNLRVAPGQLFAGANLRQLLNQHIG